MAGRYVISHSKKVQLEDLDEEDEGEYIEYKPEKKARGKGGEEEEGGDDDDDDDDAEEDDIFADENVGALGNLGGATTKVAKTKGYGGTGGRSKKARGIV